MTAFWKDAATGGLRWDDTNNNRAFLAGEIAATLTAHRSTSRPKRRRKDQGRAWEPSGVTSITSPFPPDGGNVGLSHPVSPIMVMKYSKNQKPAKDLLRWLGRRTSFAKWFEVMEGFSAGSTKYWERNPLWGGSTTR